MKMTPAIARRFAQHLEPISKINYINNGGCGLVAFHIYETLVANDFRPKLIACDNDCDMNDFKSFRNDQVTQFDVANHYFVRANGIYFDAGGAYFRIKPLADRYVYRTYNYFNIAKRDLTWALKHGEWNYMFRKYNDDGVLDFIKRHIRSFRAHVPRHAEAAS